MFKRKKFFKEKRPGRKSEIALLITCIVTGMILFFSMPDYHPSDLQTLQGTVTNVKTTPSAATSRGKHGPGIEFHLTEYPFRFHISSGSLNVWSYKQPSAPEVIASIPPGTQIAIAVRTSQINRKPDETRSVNVYGLMVNNQLIFDDHGTFAKK
jgi:hypothetical protein